MNCGCGWCLLVVALSMGDVLAAPPPGPVVVTMTQRMPMTCPPEPAERPRRNADGTYSPEWPNVAPSIVCWVESRWEEEWTDYPDKGGKRIRVVGPVRTIR